MERIAKDAGRLDGLINVAGGFRWEKLDGGTLDSWEAMYRLNLKTAVISCQAALPYLPQAGGGRIVNVGALAAAKAGAGMGAYAASKAGVAKLTEALAEELKDQAHHGQCHTAEHPRHAEESPRHAEGGFLALGDPDRGRGSHCVPGLR